MAVENKAVRRVLQEPLLRLLAINGAAGVVIALLVLGAIFWSNIGNLRVLVLTAENPVVPVVMLAVGLIITLGSVVMGSAVMLLGERERGGGASGKRSGFGADVRLQPVRVVAVSRPNQTRRRG